MFQQYVARLVDLRRKRGRTTGVGMDARDQSTVGSEDRFGASVGRDFEQTRGSGNGHSTRL